MEQAQSFSLVQSKRDLCEHNHAPLSVRETRTPKDVPCDSGWRCAGDRYCVNGIYAPTDALHEAKRKMPSAFGEMLGVLINIGRMAVKPGGSWNEKALGDMANRASELKIVFHNKSAFSVTNNTFGVVLTKDSKGKKLAVTKLIVAPARSLRDFHEEVTADLLMYPLVLKV